MNRRRFVATTIGSGAARASHIASQALVAGARVRWNAATGKVETA